MKYHWEERFWLKVNKTDGCWLWTAASRDGYGIFTIDRVVHPAHVVSWFLITGEWPDHFVLHRCDVRPCVKWEHLFAGDNLDNVLDALRKRRRGKYGALVEQIKLEHKGSTTQELALRFGVPLRAVQRIVSNTDKSRTWSRLEYRNS